MAKKKETIMARKKETDLIVKSAEPHILPCVLTTEEKASAADELATAIQRLESVDGERKATAATFKAQIDNIKDSAHKLSQKVKDGKENRAVDCELQLNHTKLTATLIRKDTNEVFDERPMTDEEREMLPYEE